MNDRQQALLRLANEALGPCGERLIGQGWRPEIVVFAPDELERIPGYKVGLILSLEPLPQQRARD